MKKLWEVEVSGRASNGERHAERFADIEARESEDACAQAMRQFRERHHHFGRLRIVRWRRQGGGSFEL